MEQKVINSMQYTVLCIYACTYISTHRIPLKHQMFIDVKLSIIPHNTKFFNAYLQAGQMRKEGVSFLPQSITLLFSNNLPVLPVQ